MRALECEAVGVCSAWKHGANLQPSSFERLTSAHGNVEVEWGGVGGLGHSNTQKYAMTKMLKL